MYFENWKYLQILVTTNFYIYYYTVKPVIIQVLVVKCFMKRYIIYVSNPLPRKGQRHFKGGACAAWLKGMIRPELDCAKVQRGVPFHHVDGGWLKLTKGCAVRRKSDLWKHSVFPILKSVVVQLLLVVGWGELEEQRIQPKLQPY